MALINKTINFLLFIAIIFSVSCSRKESIETNVPVYTYKVINEYSHDKKAFTQGLEYKDGYFYESTGLYSKSTLRKVKLDDGSIVKKYKLPDKYFGEGLTIYNDKIIQLTWKSKIGFVYDKESFDVIDTFEYDSKGWGLTSTEQNLIMSDGSSNLYFLDPETYKVLRTVVVHDGNKLVRYLNELEYINGKVFANILGKYLIVIINPTDGSITGWIDLNGIVNYKKGSKKVLNGIAYDKKNDRFFVTGKYFPLIFEIKLVPKKH